ncbi:MAG: hypothetical protein N2491_08735 [Negativicutes bacterium]|nr:hypothetical protein [Negativicutes bacterium]
MEFSQYTNIVAIGFLVWLVIAPRTRSPRYGELLLAYMTALLLSLIGTSELMMVKPSAFFFTVGGVLAFCYILARRAIRISIRK